jgi:endoglucanase
MKMWDDRAGVLYRDGEGGDTLNLYDTSALAHYELHKAITAAGRPRGLAVSRRALLRDLRGELDGARAQSRRDAFGSGCAWDRYDVTSHLLGLVATASMYDELTGTRRFAGFASRQLGAALGANAWGVAFVVGSGTTFPHCVQHQVANLVGSLDGSAPLVRGAVVNGSNDVSQFEGSSDTPGDARACPPGGGDAFAQEEEITLRRPAPGPRLAAGSATQIALSERSTRRRS